MGCNHDGFEDRVIEACNDFHDRNIYPGIAPNCDECQSRWGMTRDALVKEYEDGSLYDEGGFSYSDCECCGSQLGGDRYAAHGWVKVKGEMELCHLDVCTDCLFYLSNGDLPSCIDCEG